MADTPQSDELLSEKEEKAPDESSKSPPPDPEGQFSVKPDPVKMEDIPIAEKFSKFEKNSAVLKVEEGVRPIPPPEKAAPAEEVMKPTKLQVTSDPKKGGEERDFEPIKSLINDAAGEPEAVEGTATKITEVNLAAIFEQTAKVPQTIYLYWTRLAPEYLQNQLSLVAQRISVKEKYLLCFIIWALFVLTGKSGKFFMVCVTLMIPGIQSMKALEAGLPPAIERWLKYWVVYGIVNGIEFSLPKFIVKTPTFGYMKLVVMLWCVLPVEPRGTDVLYHAFVAVRLKDKAQKTARLVTRCVASVFQRGPSRVKAIPPLPKAVETVPDFRMKAGLGPEITLRNPEVIQAGGVKLDEALPEEQTKVSADAENILVEVAKSPVGILKPSADAVKASSVVQNVLVELDKNLVESTTASGSESSGEAPPAQVVEKADTDVKKEQNQPKAQGKSKGKGKSKAKSQKEKPAAKSKKKPAKKVAK